MFNFARYCWKPTELVLQCLPSSKCDLSTFLCNLIETRKQFLEDHRYDLSEIYSDEFAEELKAIPDPKKEPLDCLNQFLATLNEFGAWCADRAALNLIIQIEKSKIKTAYERHYLLLCLVSTTLIQIRAHCDYVFQQLPTEKERIETYSSPKVLKLIEVLRQFKSDKQPVRKTETDFLKKNLTELNSIVVNNLSGKIENVIENINNENTEFVQIKDDLNKIVNPEKSLINAESTKNDIKTLSPVKYNQNRGRNPKTRKVPFQRTTRPYNNYHQNDPDALCGIIFCNSKFVAKILFNLLYEMSKHDPDLSYLMVQFTVDRAADPLTETKQAEMEHRKQEDVLKRFRMHSCNLLIGTSVLEEGIELPKCNLVVRWDLPTTYRSYVQCKGRARSQHAYHIIMVAPTNLIHTKILNETKESEDSENENLQNAIKENGIDNVTRLSEMEKNSMNEFNTMEHDTDAFVERLAQYMQIEQVLLRKCNNREPMQIDLIEADLYTSFIKPYQPSPVENGPSVNLSTAIILVNKYCAKLPSDTFTKLTPLWRCAKTYRKSKEYYQFTVRLPINSPLKQDMLVSAEM